MVSETQNAFAGTGAVLLDIGGDIGALIVDMPADLEGVEVEISPVGTPPVHSHVHGHTHEHGVHSHHPHVAVVARPTGTGPRPSLVFGELEAGEYQLYLRTDGQVRLRASVRGGEVTEATWPAWPAS